MFFMGRAPKEHFSYFNNPAETRNAARKEQIMIDDTIKAAIESQEIENYYENDADDETTDSDDEFGETDKDGFGNDDEMDDMGDRESIDLENE